MIKNHEITPAAAIMHESDIMLEGGDIIQRGQKFYICPDSINPLDHAIMDNIDDALFYLDTL